MPAVQKREARRKSHRYMPQSVDNFSDTNRMHTTSYLRVQLLAEAVFSTITPLFEMFFGALDVSLHMRSEWAGPI